MITPSNVWDSQTGFLLTGEGMFMNNEDLRQLGVEAMPTYRQQGQGRSRDTCWIFPPQSELTLLRQHQNGSKR